MYVPSFTRLNFLGFASENYFPHYPIGESALVAELCNLIHAHLPDDNELKYEIAYNASGNNFNHDHVLTERARADLVAYTNGGPSFAFEVKRASAGRGEIETDLLGLAKMRINTTAIRIFLFSFPRHPDRRSMCLIEASQFAAATNWME